MSRIESQAQFLTDYADQAKGKGKDAEESVVIPENLAELSVEELTELRTKATDAFDTVYADGSGFTTEDIQVLSDLTTGIESLQTELAVRQEQAAELAATAAQLATKVRGEPEVEAEEMEEVPAEEAVVIEEEAAVVEPLTVEDPEQQAVKTDMKINLASASRRRANRPTPAPAPVPQDRQLGIKDMVRSAVAIGAYAAGDGVDWRDVGQIIDTRLNGFNASQYASAQASGTHLRQEFQIATIRKPLAPGHTINGTDDVDTVMRRALNEKNLPGGSLTAAGGWCAPSETKYDLLEVESTDGLLSLPEVGVTRGGIRRTLGPKFSDIYTATGFSFTEAQDIAGNYNGGPDTAKPCYTVDCPDFEDIRLNAAGLCINAGLLQAKGYPEVIARTVRGALVAHDHKMNQRIITAIAAGSDAVTVDTTGQGVTTSVLSTVELILESVRQDNRMADSTTVEAVLPKWARAALRADLALRQGVDLISVSNTRLDAYFRERNANVQYVYDWQNLAAGPAYPATLKFLAYPAGTWVRGTSEVINLDTIYDSVNLSHNNFVALFSEEGWFAAKMGWDSRVVTVDLCVNGAVGAAVDITCA